MGVRLSTDENVVALFDSVTGWAFGPTFPDSDEAQSFLDYLHSLGEDGRELSDADMSARHSLWRERRQQDDEPERFDMSGATRGADR
jgi:hypothetical protein